MATILAARWCDSSTARTTRTAYDSPFTKLSMPATIAAAAERWPPPVSDEMMRIFGAFGFTSEACIRGRFKLRLNINRPLPQAVLPLRLHDNSVGLFIHPLFHFAPRFLHFPLQFFDLDQMLWVERQGRIVTIRFMRAETAVGRLLAARFHCRRQPESLKIPVMITQVADRREVLA